MANAGSISEKYVSCFEWTISDIFALLKDYSAMSIITSPKFVCYNCTWNMKLFHRCKQEHIGLYLEKNKSDIDEKTVSFSFQLKNSEIIQEIRHRFSEKNGIDYGFAVFMKFSQLNHGLMTVICRIQEEESNPVEEKRSSLKLLDFENLSSNFEDLYVSKKMCDVIVKVEDQEFQAHKAVLVARSSVFAAMFDHAMKEKQSGVVNIPDCHPHSFGDFLQFLYTGRLKDPSFQNARHLYVTADKYDVQRLKTICLEHMKQHLAVDNICIAMDLAESYGESSLMSEAQTFFNGNAFDVISTTEWDKLSKTKHNLTKRLLQEMLKPK